jgi:hypothetical protein
MGNKLHKHHNNKDAKKEFEASINVNGILKSIPVARSGNMIFYVNDGSLGPNNNKYLHFQVNSTLTNVDNDKKSAESYVFVPSCPQQRNAVYFVNTGAGNR